MNAQLKRVISELEQLSGEAAKVTALAGKKFAERPRPDAWSVAECIEHLSLTSEAYIPLISNALEKLRQQGSRVASAPYKLDWWGRALKWTLEPPPRFRFATTNAFVPEAISDAKGVLGRFLRLQSEITGLVSSANGLDLNRMKVTSPFSSRVKYNVYSAFVLITAHEQRHLWQAKQAIGLCERS